MDVIREWWAVILSVVGGILWLGKVHSNGSQNTRDIKRLENQRHDDLENARHARDEQTEMIREMRSDIKLLLQRPTRD